MSQTKKSVPHKILVKNKNPGTISTGMNTQIYLDGKPLKLAGFAKFEFKSTKITKVTLEMYADVEIDIDAELSETKELYDSHSIVTLTNQDK